MQNTFMVKFGRSGLTRIVNTEMRNKSLVLTDSTFCANLEKQCLCWPILSKQYQTMELYLLYVKFCKFSSQHKLCHIRLAFYHLATKGKAEHFVQVFKRSLWANLNQISYNLSKPKQAKSTRNATFIVYLKDIVQYLTKRPDAHPLNYFSNKQFKLHAILSEFRYNVQYKFHNFVKFGITTKPFAIDFV